jgi:hypothetical protein
VQRGIQEAHRDGQPVHGPEDPLEVLALHGLELDQGLAQGPVVLGEDHLPHDPQPLAFHEHVLGAAQPDPLGPELSRPACLVRGVGVRPHPEVACLIGPPEHRLEVLARVRLDQRHLAADDPAVSPVYGEGVAGLEALAADLHRVPRGVYPQGVAPGHGRLAHPASNDRRVAGHPPVGGQHPTRRDHALHVVGVRLTAHQDHGLSGLGPLLRLVGGEDYLPRCRPGRGGEALRQDVELGLGVHAGVEELVE